MGIIATCQWLTHLSFVAEFPPSPYLPAGGVPPEVAEGVGEPVVDVVEGELLVGSLHDGGADQGGVGVGGPHVLHPVELPVLGKVLLGVEVGVATVMVGHLGEDKIGVRT